MFKNLMFVFLLCLAAGCASVKNNSSTNASTKDIFYNASMDKMATSMTGQPCCKRNLCPVCHRQFGGDVKNCPYDGAALNNPAK